MRKSLFAAVIVLSIGAVAASCASLDNYAQVNLTSDLPGVAANLDPDLVNPWGIVASPTSPFWISDNGTGKSTLYTGAGTKLGLIVTIPPPLGGSPPSAPTGVVFNSTAGFGGSHFIFDAEDGTVASWSGGTNAILQATAPVAGSVYKGLALDGNLLYATNFGTGKIDVYDSSFAPTSVSGGFKDASIPVGFAPFDIQNIGGNLYVTYAKQDPAKHDDVAGPGNGFVDVFDANGNLLKRLVSNGALNSPWGLALAPSPFGAFAGDLLIGNFGDGTINAYDPSTGAFEGTLDNASGQPIVIQGLWGLTFGNGQPNQNLDTLFFTAGIPGPGAVEDHGLFGSLTAVPEPRPVLAVGIFGFALFVWGFARRRLMTS